MKRLLFAGMIAAAAVGFGEDLAWKYDDTNHPADDVQTATEVTDAAFTVYGKIGGESTAIADFDGRAEYTLLMSGLTYRYKAGFYLYFK